LFLPPPGLKIGLLTMKIRTDKDGPLTIIGLSGRLTGDEGREVASAVMPLVSEPGHRVIVDLTHVDRIDSSGLGSLVTLTCRSNVNKGHLIFAGPTMFVNEVIEVTQLHRFLRIAADLEAARSAASE
jgi:anti-anti-sigma factor